MRKILIAVAAIAMAAARMPSARAQDGSDAAGAELMTLRYVESYDSLMSSYYMRRHAHHGLRAQRELSLDEFDALPDSVLIARLQALHTVIPLTYNEVVRSHIRFYLKVMATKLDVMLTLSEYYHPMFEEALSRYGVPEELKYLTIVESAMNPQATSRVGAAGLWQFMYSTGKLYDLEVNSVVDERRDPFKSTVAAARHLADLHRVFGDWELAIAAYNCGSGNINKAIARSGGRTGFWDIYYNLPRETRGYIPSLVAVIYVMNYYEEHGLRPGRVSLPLRSDTVMVHRDVLMPFVAQATGMEIDELRTLNPQYRVDYIPASAGGYPICLPYAKVELFINAQDTIYARTADSLSRRPIKVQPRGQAAGSTSSGGKYYTVRKGDTLSKIASRNGISVSTLKKRNGLKGDNIRVGQKLRLR